jgi:hypothetical protein
MRVWTKSEGEGENRFAVVSFAHFFSLKSRSLICFSLNGHHIFHITYIAHLSNDLIFFNELCNINNFFFRKKLYVIMVYFLKFNL